MSTKHIFDSSDGLVLKSLRGAVALSPALRIHSSSKSVYVAHPAPNTHLAVISGGGAGHEPAHAGYTGHGMLAASLSGDIFASPSARSILATIHFAAFASSSVPLDPTAVAVAAPAHAQASLPNPREVLVVINNYTGDRLNFGLAIEQARRAFTSLHIDAVVVADDVSLLDQPSLVGPRGLGGNIIVCKILGAYAASGGRLARAKELGDAVVGELASVGVGLAHCHIPGRKVVEEEGGAGALRDGEAEIGLGLHNEPGVRRVKMESAEALVKEMIELVLGSRGVGKNGRSVDEGPLVRPDDEVVLYVNNLGGISQLEMGAVLDEIVIQLSARNIHPSRVYLAPFMTSLNAPGFSLSILNISRIQSRLSSLLPSSDQSDNNNDEPPSINVLDLLDAPTDAHSWLGVRVWSPSRRPADNARDEEEAEVLLRASGYKYSVDGSSGGTPLVQSHSPSHSNSAIEIERAIRQACKHVMAAEPAMTRYDTVVGDGDCGETFAGGAKAILAALDNGTLSPTRMAPATLVEKAGVILEGSMGGTIGALFALFFTAWSAALLRSSTTTGSAHLPLTLLTLPAALSALGTHTPARPGDRTIVDALAPFCAVISSSPPPPSTASEEGGASAWIGMLGEAVKAARRGAEGTRGMKARLGRAVYVGGGEDGSEGGGLPPDPGAWGVAAIVEGFLEGLKG
ncbi:hypothetical protein SERLA73DRAFT_169673 [Serpula lacrymans var. lacrymans S7.3]|uniref:Dihydroxyacetone kinase n=2 Tax=Serpula lacrymans var. lacrymans TaxID=341189 RepID=F8Q279_SERL3|nr:uncharacterized protein SERLADRAFT_450606 [Serpula lacrymans var. lacrymans S7.9]EGN97290.1 hypothetical protein SERLA73DRAFT_169673 [Serpula lacrymans var. lacrymans S7.3]EGO22879.1 hypothetical protein SERLADRAFT_450606 [Serpula lacrymans var. lacrymans S7.9]